MNLSVYPKRCQELQALFEAAPNLQEVLIVPLDTAKRTHVGRICDGAGRYVYKRPFSVENTAAGVTFLRERIEKARRKTGVPMQQVVVAMEDPPNYAINFAHRVADLNCLVVRVNARDASRKRKSCRGSSDVSALDGICRMVMDQQAYLLAPECGAFAEMSLAARERRRLVRTETGVKNMIHRCVEVVFPGFADVPGIELFGGPAMRLMKNDFHAARIGRMRSSTLSRKLRSYGQGRAEEVATALAAAAKNTAVCNGLYAEQAVVLAQHVRTLENLQASIRLQTQAMGRALATTDGVYLTTIPGIGVVLAGQIVAELGMSGLYGQASRSASYAGIIPKDSQTGGPNSPVRHGHLPKDRNSRLKDYLMQAADHVGKTPLPTGLAPGCDGVHDLMAYYSAKTARGEKSRLGTSRKLLRIMRAMARSKMVYQPPIWFERHRLVPDFEACYLESMLAALTRKWKTVGLSTEEDNELGTITRAFRGLAEDYRAGRMTTLED